ncbi:MAG: hypothetical protein ACTTKL_07535 [Treponema sp.]
MSVNVGNLINKTKIVPFLNKGTDSAPEWLQIKKSTSFNLSMNPTTKSFSFISEINETEEVTGYKPALPQEIVMFKGEPDYDMVFDLLYHRYTGAEAHKQVLIAFYQEERKYTPAGGEEKTIFMGWLVDALVKVNNLDTENTRAAENGDCINEKLHSARYEFRYRKTRGLTLFSLHKTLL